MRLFQPNDLKVADAISTLYRQICSLGAADVVVANEVAEFEVAAQQVGKTNQVGEHFKRSLNTLPPSHVLWAGVYDHDGSCICTVASRFQDIQGRSLERHLAEYLERTFEDEDGGKVALQRGSLSGFALIEGPFVYVGEGFVRNDSRGKNYLGLLQRMLIISAYHKFRPNLIYGFMTPRMIRMRYHTNWGYSIARPCGLIWDRQPKNSDWRSPYLVGLASEGICRLVEDPLMAGLSRHRESTQTDTSAQPYSEMAAQAADI
ncbi:hypothetical protein AB1P65_09360 [Roseibium alexandrii]